MTLRDTVALMGLSWFFTLVVTTQVLPLDLLVGDFVLGVIAWTKICRQPALLQLNLPKPPATKVVEHLALAA